MPVQSMSPSRQTLDWSGSRAAGSPAAPALSAREASCLFDALVRLYHLGMVGAFRQVLFQQQSGTQALQHYDELQQRLPVSSRCPLTFTALHMIEEACHIDLGSSCTSSLALLLHSPCRSCAQDREPHQDRAKDLRAGRARGVGCCERIWNI